MNPGTINNNERSGDRDLYWSNVLRLPYHPSGKLRVCDNDPTIFCDACSLPIFMAEVCRHWNFKGTRYTINQAKKMEIEAYLIRHNGNQEKGMTHLTITRLRDNAGFDKESTPEDLENLLKKWCERKFSEHLKVCLVQQR